MLLLPRRAAPAWAALAGGTGQAEAALSHRGRRVAEHLENQGASFFDDIVAACRLLPAEAEEALAELVVRGRAHCDSFLGLRALLMPAARRAATARRRRPLFGIADAGRWTAVRRPAAEPDAQQQAAAVEHVVRTLLRRYGVLCWRLMEREAPWLPPWRELVRVLRRLEARGEVRGGRFIAGLTGEQFALPEAIVALRAVRREPPLGELVCVAASDPANLLGSLLPGARVPRVAGARVAYLDGVPVATLAGGRVEFRAPVEAAAQQAVRRLLQLDPAVRGRSQTAAPHGLAAPQLTTDGE